MRVLLGIENLEQGRGGIAAEVAANLIHLVQHEDRVASFRAADALYDLPGQRPDISPPVAANLRLVVDSAQ